MTTTDRMTGAEFAARRHLLGLTLDELASILGVNPRTVRAWEAERDPIPPRVPDELDALIVEHTALTQEVAAAGSMQIVRAKGRPMTSSSVQSSASSEASGTV